MKVSLRTIWTALGAASLLAASLLAGSNPVEANACIPNGKDGNGCENWNSDLGPGHCVQNCNGKGWQIPTSVYSFNPSGSGSSVYAEMVCFNQNAGYHKVYGAAIPSSSVLCPVDNVGNRLVAWASSCGGSTACENTW
jgi:hypothetical protein